MVQSGVGVGGMLRVDVTASQSAPVAQRAVTSVF